MKNEDIGSAPFYDEKTKTITKTWGRKDVYTRKEFMEAYKQTENKYEGMKANYQQMKDNVDKSKEDIKTWKLMVQQMKQIVSQYEESMQKDCQKDVEDLMEKKKIFTFLEKFNPEWTEDSYDWRVFEDKRTKKIQQIHMDKTLTEKYPDYMIKHYVWADKYNPMKKGDK